jgi:3-dehydroquinate synthase
VEQVTVAIPSRSYPVTVGAGALRELQATISRLAPTGVAIITDQTVGQLYGRNLAAEQECRLYEVEPGESAKTLTVLGQVLEFLEDCKIDRKGLVIALGGGVVGDLAGFAASVWKRGIRFIQVPTTVIAMVDSSVGGKTGIDTRRSKNAIGTFWQPSAVLADTRVLSTLPDEEMTAGLAEVIKYAISLDAELVRVLQTSRGQLLARDPQALERIVAGSVGLKANVVVEDERDHGPRAVLNYGHTTGHAIEVASGFRISHGRAIAQGMRVAARLAQRLGLCDRDLVKTQDELLADYGLPGQLPKISPETVLAVIPRDAKAIGGRVGWVLPEKIGRARVGMTVPQELVEKVVKEVFAE